MQGGGGGGLLGVGMHDSQAEKLCLNRGGQKKHTSALTSGTFACCNVVSVNKTSVCVCVRASLRQL